MKNIDFMYVVLFYPRLFQRGRKANSKAKDLDPDGFIEADVIAVYSCACVLSTRAYRWQRNSIQKTNDLMP
jgi:hypothetical protein